jgi:hypothetical protein
LLPGEFWFYKSVRLINISISEEILCFILYICSSFVSTQNNFCNICYSIFSYWYMFSLMFSLMSSDILSVFPDSICIVTALAWRNPDFFTLANSHNYICLFTAAFAYSCQNHISVTRSISYKVIKTQIKWCDNLSWF